MNFQELRNLCPITTVNVPAVPAFQGKQVALGVCESRSRADAEQPELTHLKRPTHSWDSEMPDKHRQQPTGQTGALPPGR